MCPPPLPFSNYYVIDTNYWLTDSKLYLDQGHLFDLPMCFIWSLGIQICLLRLFFFFSSPSLQEALFLSQAGFSYSLIELITLEQAPKDSLAVLLLVGWQDGAGLPDCTLSPLLPVFCCESSGGLTSYHHRKQVIVAPFSCLVLFISCGVKNSQSQYFSSITLDFGLWEL